MESRKSIIAQRKRFAKAITRYFVTYDRDGENAFCAHCDRVIEDGSTHSARCVVVAAEKIAKSKKSL